MENYQYAVRADWTAERMGRISGEGIGAAMDFSAPPEFQGRAGFWTPEHFFTAAIASCFITTFAAIAQFSKFTFETLTVQVNGSLEKGEGGFSFTKAVVRPVLTIGDRADRERAMRLLEKAERACLISRSLKTAIELQPEIVEKEISATI